MRQFLYISMLFFSVLFFGQKIKIKKEIIYVDGKEWLLEENDTFDYSVFDKNKKEIIFIKYIRQNTNDSLLFNRFGKPNYYLVKFIGTGKSIEIRELPEDILKIIYKSNVVNQDLTLNPDNVNILVEKYGNDFSKDSGSTNIINL